jgi:hypothetical protein
VLLKLYTNWLLVVYSLPQSHRHAHIAHLTYTGSLLLLIAELTGNNLVN